MAIQILPLLGGLSNVAGTAWDLYRRAAQFSETKRSQQAQDSLAKSVDRTADDRYGDGGAYPVAYALRHAIRIDGPFAAGGVGQRLRLGGGLSFVGRAAVGVLFGAARDNLTASASRGSEAIAADVAGAGDATRFAGLFVLPEVGLEVRLGSAMLGLGAGALAFVTDGPALPTGAVFVAPGKCPGPSQPGALGCAPGSGVAANERAYGPFIAAMPLARFGWVF